MDNNSGSSSSNNKPVRHQPTSPGTVPPETFYASASKSNAGLTPPPLPLRPKGSAGSAHTKVNIEPPPTYDTVFREPQLVSEDTIGTDQVPALIPADDHHNWPTVEHKWGEDDWNKNEAWNEPMPWDSSWAGGTSQKVMDIDARDQEEETNWWDAELRGTRNRPGPGMLPPFVAELLHNAEHSLFSVSVTAPDVKPAGDVSPFIPPSHDEILRAVPHANTYYCRRHHGWVFLQWKTSNIVPPFAKSFDFKKYPPLPDQDRRKRTVSCTDDSFDKSKKTHHFHCYPRAVDSGQLNPAFHRAPWEVAAQRKQKRRKITSANIDDYTFKESDVKMNEDLPEGHVEGELLDLYVCCQCSVYCIASEAMPGVIALKYLEDFTKYRYEHPPIGRQPDESVVSGWETLIAYAHQFAPCVMISHLFTELSKTNYGKARTVSSPFLGRRSRTRSGGPQLRQELSFCCSMQLTNSFAGAISSSNLGSKSSHASKLRAHLRRRQTNFCHPPILNSAVQKVRRHV